MPLSNSAAGTDPFAALPAAAFAVAPAGAVTAWNAAAERAFGWRAVEVRGALPPLFAGDVRDSYLSTLARVLAGQWDGPFDVACARRDGSVQPARFRVAPMHRGSCLAGAVFMEVEAAAPRVDPDTERERRFRAVLDAIPAPIFFKDAEGVYRGCNAEFERFLGRPRDQIVDRTVYGVAPADLAAVYQAADLALFRSGGTQTYEGEVQWADGTRRTVVFRKAAIVDAAGAVAGLAGTMLDVTELRAAERELRARLVQQAALTRLAARAVDEEDPRRLLDAAVRLAVAAHGAEGGIVCELGAEGGRRLLRLAAAVGPQPAAGALPLDEDPVSRRVVETGRPLVLDGAGADGLDLPPSLRGFGPVSLASVLVGAREAPLGVLTVFGRAPRNFSDDDVQSLEATAHVLAIALGRGRALEVARSAQEHLARSERLASIGRLAAGVAHELNNPLTFVLSNIGFVTDGLRRLRGAAPDSDPFDEALRALDDAAEGAERMRLIVRDLRTFGREDSSEGPVEVRRAVEYAANLASNVVRRRARLTWDLGSVPPVRGNEARLGQVLLNLLVNAAHAIPEGDPSRHEIRVRARTEGPGRVAISVSDTGAGIPPEVCCRIFDPFFTTKPAGLGTGLGLWICHNIVLAAGGTIDVESSPGAGTTFRVVLPAAGPAEEAVPVGPEAVPDTDRTLRRILVVDDEPLVAATVRRHLAGVFSVDAASGADEALALLAGHERYDAVVCDVVMPGGGGLSLLSALRASAPEVAERFLFVTGGASAEDAAVLAATGLPLLEKPFDGRQLRAALRRVLDHAGLRPVA